MDPSGFPPGCAARLQAPGLVRIGRFLRGPGCRQPSHLKKREPLGSPRALAFSFVSPSIAQTCDVRLAIRKLLDTAYLSHRRRPFLIRS